MENIKLNKNLEYGVTFKKVQNLNEIKKSKDYVGSVKMEGNVYAITIDENSKKKSLARELIPFFKSSFKDIFYAEMKAGVISKGIVFSQETELISPFSKS